MSDEEIKQWFEKYRKESGRPKVISDLTGEGLSARFAEKAANGDWKAKILQRRIRSALLNIKAKAS